MNGWRGQIRPKARALAAALVAVTALGFVAITVACAFFWRDAGKFAGYSPTLPSRLYGRAMVLRRGDPVVVQAIARHLEATGYHEVAARGVMAPGTWSRKDRVLSFARYPDTAAGISRSDIEVREGAVAALLVDGRTVDLVELDAPLIASYYGPDLRECEPVTLAELSEQTVGAVLAAEDDAFFSHRGVVPSSILRAALANLRAGRIRQGGSTITQQLARGLYLSRARTWSRKYREALLSLVLEVRYPKRRLLEAYLNEIYMGKSGSVNLIGIGAAARAYFDKDASRLTLAEAGLLAGMIRSPGDYSPIEAPVRALARRNHVLDRMAQLGWIDATEAARASLTPLGLRARPLPAYEEAGYFADAMAEEARERYALAELDGAGYRLYSTLDIANQHAANSALSGLGADGGGGGAPALQGALVSIDPRDGAILAWTGGRDYADSMFDRVRSARRPAGSAFKPLVYASALIGGANLADLVEDAPLVVQTGGEEWRPQNDDHAFRGVVTVRTAMEQSLNVPTVHLAFEAGLASIAELARRFGLPAAEAPTPAIAIGSIDVTPLELATAYATLADGGRFHSPHGLVQVVDRTGSPVPGTSLPRARRALDQDTAFLVTSLLRGVVDHGTGASARRLGIRWPLAGKTGTSDGGRDAWFVGYSPVRATAVWVGRDDDLQAGLSGSRSALPLWTRFTVAVTPGDPRSEFDRPAGVVAVEIDPETGGLATRNCPRTKDEYFYTSRTPVFACPLHSGGEQWASVAAPLGDSLPSRPLAARTSSWLAWTEHDRSSSTVRRIVVRVGSGAEIPSYLFASSQRPE